MYRLQVSTCDLTTKEKTSVVCLICMGFGCVGKEENDLRKRKRSMNEKYFCSSWRYDNFASHMQKQHPSKLEEYKILSTNEKKAYVLENKSEQVINMRSFFQPQANKKARLIARLIAKKMFKFLIDNDIVHDIIAYLLFDSNVECLDTVEISQLEKANESALNFFLHTMKTIAFLWPMQNPC